MKTILIDQGWIINEGKKFRGSILIEGDTIKAIYTGGDRPELPSGCEIVNAYDKLVIPGVIDDQVHFRDPGLTHKGDIASETMAAAAGGITSVMEMPNTNPQTITNKLLKEKQLLGSEKAVTNFSFYLGATNDNIEEIRRVDPDTTCGVKVFMGASTGNMLVDNEESLRRIFSESRILVACHCEDEPIIQKNLAKEIEKHGDDIPIENHPLIRSRESCYKSSSYAVKLAKEHGTRLHILHLSTADEMVLFNNQVPLTEKMITAEVCVHHLWFDDSDYQEKKSFIKWNPAIKTAFDKNSLRNSVNRDLIDIIATDHAPHTISEKQQKYTKSPSGGPLVQHSLVAMLDLWHEGVLSIEKIVEKMCHNPATLFGVEKRGFIREGYRADITIIDPDKEWTVTSENILYKCAWSPFEGHTFKSSVIKTYINGNLVWNDGVLDDTVKGVLLTFKR